MRRGFVIQQYSRTHVDDRSLAQKISGTSDSTWVENYTRFSDKNVASVWKNHCSIPRDDMTKEVVKDDESHVLELIRSVWKDRDIQ